MARPLRVDVPSGIYHVIARGNERKAIFRDDADRDLYLRRLTDCRRRFGFFLYAYCLMDNHVHLVLERGPTPLSRIMLALQSSYAQRFNRRHDRVGHLFQGRFKAYLVQKDRYFLALLRYVHRNPVAAGLAARPVDYPWSSDRFYRRGLAPGWLDLDRGLRLLASGRSAALARYRLLMDGAPSEPYEDVPAVATVIKGEEIFAARVLEGLGLPAPRFNNWSPESIASRVAAARGLSLGELRRRGQLGPPSRARSVAAYLGRNLAGIPVSRMAKYFGREESTLQRGVLRLEAALAADRGLRRELGALARALQESTGVQG